MFYENFERLCKKAGTSPSAAGVAIGKAKNTAGGWKRNGTIPKEDELIELAKLLNCRVADFFREDGQVHFKSREDMVEYWEYVNSINPLNVDAPSSLSGSEGDFVEIFRGCNKRQQAQLMVLVYGFAEENGIDYGDAK